MKNNTSLLTLQETLQRCENVAQACTKQFLSDMAAQLDLYRDRGASALPLFTEVRHTRLVDIQNALRTRSK